MNSESKSLRSRSGAALAGMALGLAVLAAPVRAEDPLLGRIKVIKCVGCNPGAVNLIVHDPIDVRDFEVQIKESDYQKIVTPLAGKTIYDKEGCFYWIDLPKDAKPASKEPVKEGSVRDGAAKKGAKKESGSDSAAPGKDGLLETSAPPEAPVIEGKPSRCIPFVRIEVKPTHPDGKKDEE